MLVMLYLPALTSQYKVVGCYNRYNAVVGRSEIRDIKDNKLIYSFIYTVIK